MHPLRDLLPAALVQLVREQPLSDAKLQFAWRTAAGAAMARATTVELQQGNLRVTVSDTNWRREVRRLAPAIRERLDTLLGAGVVKRLTIAR